MFLQRATRGSIALYAMQTTISSLTMTSSKLHIQKSFAGTLSQAHYTFSYTFMFICWSTRTYYWSLWHTAMPMASTMIDKYQTVTYFLWTKMIVRCLKLAGRTEMLLIGLMCALRSVRSSTLSSTTSFMSLTSSSLSKRPSSYSHLRQFLCLSPTKTMPHRVM